MDLRDICSVRLVDVRWIDVIYDNVREVDVTRWVFVRWPDDIRYVDVTWIDVIYDNMRWVEVRWGDVIYVDEIYVGVRRVNVR